ncbi:MAG: phosphoribosylglycinamide formyltransferase [Oscillospiraceae bacterium]|nr:phosphoribosylglycinamide formyltransferase [Oscillospiraceae bacterium]
MKKSPLVRTAVLVSGGGTNLQAIIAAKLFGEIQNCDLVAVISSNHGAYALDRARAAGIDASVVDVTTFPTKRTFNTALMQKLKDLDVDLVVLAGFMQVLQRPICKEWENRIINVHPALIPSFSGEGCYGLKVHQMALDYGVKVTGATVHFVTEEVDAGPIILQKAIDILPNDTAKSLQRRVMEQAEWDILPKAIDLFCRGKLRVEGRRVIIEE